MREKILRALKELESKEQCRFLFAAESGSRAWGFASPDSDYDVRAVYVEPESWYWDIAEKKRDTIEARMPGDLDISAWELRKTLRLFGACNPSLNEWLGSPVIYFADGAFFETLKGLLPGFFNPVRAGHHYLALAENAWKTLSADNAITLKKLFYAQRGLFCAMWSARFRTMPPTKFDDLLIPELLPDGILRLIRRLKVRKEQACEKESVALPGELYDFYTVQRASVLRDLAAVKFTPPGNTALNDLFRRCVTSRP